MRLAEALADGFQLVTPRAYLNEPLTSLQFTTKVCTIFIIVSGDLYLAVLVKVNNTTIGTKKQILA